ncbi:DUF5009 domain-containing protein [Mucilaginibacter paludis]|uniref:DUF5009 domain-containing protein n=1 Tax=Mucilaginibacter paludis DSM 18603 TaxID=714943 RepID=H1Y4I8_9SPHI|nr:DUF5009 domain-containing protein [Mucilaginibacter paludis]EHQ26772.1 Protein of unknown function DUF2261, transmembrane [Mucilaginibacter paludis DSM 18603]
MSSKFINRVHSIDIFRAVTMFLMIFVNDIDGVPGVPEWIKHAGERTDGLGLADIVFPAFLFIVGLSIPHAIQSRISRGDSKTKIAAYIVMRALALIFIGFIHANMETYSDTAVIAQPWWEIQITLSFFLIWIDYPKHTPRLLSYSLRGAGFILLIVMCALYKGGTAEAPTWLHFTWWGILGLIGWAYLMCALIYLYSDGELYVLVAAWIFFLLFNLDFHFGWLNFLNGTQNYIGLAGNGAMQAFTASGLVISVLYNRFTHNRQPKLIWVALFLLSIILFNMGFIVRFFSGGISKANDTPSWVMICTAINIIAYGAFMFLMDMKGKTGWFDAIKPAGTSTLTCYLLPFLFYPLYQMTDIGYPDFLTHGTGGLIKCLIFAFLMVWLAGVLEKKHVRLRL